MEADSTTIEQDIDSSDPYGRNREEAFLENISKNDTFFKEQISPLLLPDNDKALIDWMQENNLIPREIECNMGAVECSMKLSSAKKVIDKYQWQCCFCMERISVREDTIFKNVYCSLQTVIKIILAWCQDVDFKEVANVFGLKKNLVNNLYDKIEKAIVGRPYPVLGGPDSVILVQLYPDFIEELYPVSSKNDSSVKMQHKILCIADTKCIPTRYWLHVITGKSSTQTENNNNISKKLNLCEEILDVLKKYTVTGGYLAIGCTKKLQTAFCALKSQPYAGSITMNDGFMNSNKDIRSFMHSIWEPVIKVCEAAHDLPKCKMQAYLSCALWRWDTNSSEFFESAIELISQMDYSPILKLQ